MTITYEPLTGGLRKLHADTYAAKEPHWTARLLAHNQELISDTFRPRHLVNDWPGVGKTNLEVSTAGILVAQYGRIPREPGMQVYVRVNMQIVDAYAVDLYAVATQSMIGLDWTDVDGEEPVTTRLANTAQYSTIQAAASAARQWYEMVIEPPQFGLYFYLSVWAQANSASCTTNLYGISAVERRKWEAA